MFKIFSPPSVENDTRSPEEIKRYSVGTLTYTKATIVWLFCWMVWGDLVFNLMERALPTILPLQLRGIGASNMVISLLITTLPAIFGVFIGPIISWKSDRHRGKWGRRQPFILWTIPPLVLCLLGIGFTDEIVVFFRSNAETLSIFGLTPLTASLIVIGFFVAAFSFFNEFVGNVYYFLFNDVVPRSFLGRFFGLKRFFGSFFGIAWGLYVYPYIESNSQDVYFGIALLYFFGFGLVTLLVREGEYPPIDDDNDGKPLGYFTQVKMYFKECFTTHPIYVWTYLYMFISKMRIAAGFAGIFFSFQIGLTLRDMGIISVVFAVPALFLAYPMGAITDRFHPINVLMLMKVILIPTQFLAFFYKIDLPSVLALGLFIMPLSQLWSAASMPMLMMIFPKTKYGQFSSAQALFASMALMVGGVFAGAYFDYFLDYRYIWIWFGAFDIIGLIILWALFRNWLKLGGRDGYVAPLPKGDMVEAEPEKEATA